MNEFKVLIFELLAVDGFAARALHCNRTTVSILGPKKIKKIESEASGSVDTSTAEKIRLDTPRSSARTLPLVKSPP